MRFLQAFFLALIGSIVANLAILFVLRPFVINPAMPLHALSVGPVVMLTTIGVLGATAVYALARMVIREVNIPFIWISVIVLLLSFIPDYLIIGVTTGAFAGGSVPTAATLALMHVVSAAIIVWSLITLWGPRVSTPAKV